MRSKTLWYHGWNIVAVCVVMQTAALGVMANCFSFFLKDWSREFAMPISTFALAITLFSIPASLTAPLCGWMVSRFPIRNVLMAGMLGVIGAHALIGFATSGWHVIAVYALLLPLAVSMVGGVPTQTLISRWFVRRRGFAFSLGALGLVAAGVIFPPLVVWMLSAFGWRATWWIFAAIYFVLVLSLIMLFVRERPDSEEGRFYVGAEIHTQQDAHRTPLSLREILLRRNFVLTVTAFVPVLLVNTALSVNFAPLMESRGLTSGAAAALIVMFNSAAAAGKLLAGTLSDRCGNRLPLVVLSAATTLGALGLTFLSGAAPTAIAIMMVGLGQGLWVLVASCMAMEFGSVDFPRAYGLASASSVLITLAAPVLALIAERSGAYTPGLLGLGVLCLVSVGASLLFRDRPPVGVRA